RPVVVAPRGEARHRARRVGIVPLTSVERRVQQADVEVPRNGRRIAEREVLRDLSPREALPVYGELLEAVRLRAVDAELDDSLGQPELAGHLVRRVVVARDDEDARAGLAQPGELRGEEEAGRVVAPVAVVDVARQQEGADVFLEAGVDERLEGAAGRAPELVDGGTLVALEAAQGAVEVQVGRVDELHDEVLEASSRGKPEARETRSPSASSSRARGPT